MGRLCRWVDGTAPRRNPCGHELARPFTPSSTFSEDLRCRFAEKFSFFGNVPGDCGRWQTNIRLRYLIGYE